MAASRIGSLALPARWEDISPAPVATPLNVTPLLALRLATRHSDAELATSGLTGILETARENLQRKVQSAHNELYEYGVTREELRLFVEGGLRRGAASSLPPFLGPD